MISLKNITLGFFGNSSAQPSRKAFASALERHITAANKKLAAELSKFTFALTNQTLPDDSSNPDFMICRSRGGIEEIPLAQIKLNRTQNNIKLTLDRYKGEEALGYYELEYPLDLISLDRIMYEIWMIRNERSIAQAAPAEPSPERR